MGCVGEAYAAALSGSGGPNISRGIMLTVEATGRNKTVYQEILSFYSQSAKRMRILELLGEQEPPIRFDSIGSVDDFHKSALDKLTDRCGSEADVERLLAGVEPDDLAKAKSSFGSRATRLPDALKALDLDKPAWTGPKTGDIPDSASTKTIRIDGQDLPMEVQAWLRPAPAPRSGWRQRLAGLLGPATDASGNPLKWHGCHLIPAQCGGPTAWWNLAPGSPTINLSYMKTTEEQMAKLVYGGKPLFAKISLKYEAGGGAVPRWVRYEIFSEGPGGMPVLEIDQIFPFDIRTPGDGWSVDWAEVE